MGLFGFVAGVFPLFDGDIFWHLAAGRWIFEHGQVPDSDPFRFTAEGVPWIDHEWLFQVLVRAMELVGGLSLIFWAKVAALGGLAYWLFRDALRAGLVPGLAALVSIGATMGVRPRFLARPEIVTLFAILLLLRLLERRERNRLALAVLVVVWADRGLDLDWIVVLMAGIRLASKRGRPGRRSFRSGVSSRPARRSPGCYRPRFSSASTA